MAKLGERGPPGVLDRAQRLAGSFGVGQQRFARLGLHHHHADAVCDHVVQVARDAGPLLCRDGPGLRSAAALQFGGLRRQLLDELLP